LIKHKLDLYTKDNLIVIISGKIRDQKAVEDQITTLFAELPEKRRIEMPKFQ
jgi:predicted Zn-dependent peptidase